MKAIILAIFMIFAGNAVAQWEHYESEPNFPVIDCPGCDPVLHWGRDALLTPQITDLITDYADDRDIFDGAYVSLRDPESTMWVDVFFTLNHDAANGYGMWFTTLNTGISSLGCFLNLNCGGTRQAINF